MDLSLTAMFAIFVVDYMFVLIFLYVLYPFVILVCVQCSHVLFINYLASEWLAAICPMTQTNI